MILPPRSPNLHAYCERFVRSIKEEALIQMLILGERSLEYVIQQYLAHYHAERNHQGLGNQLIAPAADLGSHSGQVRWRNRLGGLLRYYLSRRSVTRHYFSTIRVIGARQKTCVALLVPRVRRGPSRANSHGWEYISGSLLGLKR